MLKEAYSGAQGPQWQAAMNKEVKNIDNNNIYDKVRISKDVKPISTKPVLKIKLDKNRNIKRFKIQIVAHGFI